MMSSTQQTASSFSTHPPLVISSCPFLSTSLTLALRSAGRQSYQSLKKTASVTKYFLAGFFSKASSIELKICLALRWFMAQRNPSGRKFMFLSSSSVLSQKASRCGWKVTKYSSSFEVHCSAAARASRQRRRHGSPQDVDFKIINDCHQSKNKHMPCSLAINNFNRMDLSDILEPAPLRKISNSSFQFRQLIDSLRNNQKAKNEIISVPSSQEPPKQNDVKEQSTLIVSQENAVCRNNHFLTHKESDTNLQPKPKVEVGDRDKLKKKPIVLDINPELSPTNSREVSPIKPQTSIHLQEQPSKVIFNSYTSPRVNASTQCELESNPQINFIPISSAREQVKTGQIVRQKVNRQQQKQVEILNPKKIRDIGENIVLEYVKKEKKITSTSAPSEIFDFFTNLCISCDIIIKNPSIKKFKNCVYYGFPIQIDSLYEGFLYFYDQKIYYGEFMNGFKHGLGVELNLPENIKMKGQFQEGRKTGKFYIEKPNEKYIGYLQNGQYQGEGRLTTDNYIYEGLFERGEKNGYGQQFYPKTGVKLSGFFNNGVLLTTKGSKSIPQIRNKTKSMAAARQKAKLQLIRKRSLQKHNQRMNRIREKSQKQTEYQMQFNATEQYEAPKVAFNPSKLEMYRQIPQKLPKICQEFQYSFETGSHFDSINSQHAPSHESRFHTPRLKAMQIEARKERIGTSQLEEPLPTPCLTVLRGRG